MSDTNAAAPQPGLPIVQDDVRTVAIVVYVLYLAAAFSGGIAGIAGVIVAYIKRDESRGTIWESHFENQITSFWTWLLLFVAGICTAWMLGLGVLLIIGAFVFILYRTIKGLLRAIESRPYA